MSYLLNINLQIPNTNFSEKSAFEPGLLFLREKGISFKFDSFPYFLPNPYTRMCVLTIGSFSLFGKKVKIIVNYNSDLGFGGFL